MVMKKKLVLSVVMSMILTFMSFPKPNAASYTASVDINTTYQTLEGFGAAIAWYNDYLTTHPNKNDLYKVLFYDSGLDILRLRNQYRNSNNFAYDDKEIVEYAKIMNPELKVLLCSWSPPEDLKKNGVMNGGTLAKENGSFVYDKFADYWYNSLVAYKAKGIVPDYISIQNEVEYENADWETCIFKETETSEYPGYGKALDAVYKKIKDLPDMPKMLGVESAGIMNNTVQNYAKEMDLSQVYGIAHHLYNGGDANNPDSFNSIFESLARDFADKPLFMTEYDYGTPFTTAELIHNSLVVEGVSAYFYWDLIWENQQRPLVAIEKPRNTNEWTTKEGYIISDFYPIIQQYAKFTDPGYKRVEASCSANDVKVSAFVSPDKSKLTMILINKASSENTVTLDLNGYSSSKSVVYRTLSNRTEGFKKVGSLSGNTVTLPAQSVVTVALGVSDEASTPPALPTPTPKPESRSAFELIQAEDYNSMSGVQCEVISDDGNKTVGYIEGGDHICFKGVDFGTGATGFEARISSAESGGKIEIRLDELYGTTVASIPVSGTGDWNKYTDIKASVEGLKGKHDLYLFFSGGGGYLFNIDSFVFTGGVVVNPTPTPPQVKIGDVNGDGSFNSIDFGYMRQYMLGIISKFPSENGLAAADVDGNGEVNSIDFGFMRQHLLGRINKFPVE